MYGHSAVLLAALGQCADDPCCPAPAIVADDDDPAVRRCARHASSHLRLAPVREA